MKCSNFLKLLHNSNLIKESTNKEVKFEGVESSLREREVEIIFTFLTTVQNNEN